MRRLPLSPDPDLCPTVTDREVHRTLLGLISVYMFEQEAKGGGVGRPLASLLAFLCEEEACSFLVLVEPGAGGHIEGGA